MEIHKPIREDCHQVIDEMLLGLLCPKAHSNEHFSEELRMKRVSAKCVSGFFVENQKQSLLNPWRELKEQLECDTNLFLKFITGDENWCYGIYGLGTEEKTRCKR